MTTGESPRDLTSNEEWKLVGHSFEFYFGDSPNYILNEKMPGGPFLKPPDSSNYLYDEFFGYKAWPFGIELFPNLEGRYVHIVSDEP